MTVLAKIDLLMDMCVCERERGKHPGNQTDIAFIAICFQGRQLRHSLGGRGQVCLNEIFRLRQRRSRFVSHEVAADRWRASSATLLLTVMDCSSYRYTNTEKRTKPEGLLSVRAHTHTHTPTKDGWVA